VTLVDGFVDAATRLASAHATATAAAPAAGDALTVPAAGDVPVRCFFLVASSCARRRCRPASKSALLPDVPVVLTAVEDVVIRAGCDTDVD